jgi:serine phosphatase RsbU (regulator of sigma subunit)
VRVRRNRLGDHVDTLSASFALARAFMFAGYLGEAEEVAADCERQAAALLHASARARVRVAAMRALLLEERGQLQEAESRCICLVSRAAACRWLSS